MTAMRIVIAEDSAVLRDGLQLLLTTRGHTVEAAVSTGLALQEAVRQHNPDIAVVDVRMPPTFTDEGIKAAIAIRQEHPTVGLLVFSQHIETRYAAELLASGASGVGYLLKDRVADVRDFVEACERIAAGGTVLDPEVVTQVLGASRRAQDLSALTAREREVLGLMAEGRTNTAIAKTLFVSEGSVEKHISSIFTKLGLPPSNTDHRRVLAVLRYLES
jgi:DNA-binding NarL/FixJ family response regulator